METIRVERSGGIATLTISRPKALNALDAQVLSELKQAVDALYGDAALRAVILTGDGEKAFVAGADIKAMADMPAADAEKFALAGHALGHAIEALPVPVLAAVNGFALGGGLELALTADIIYASDNAKLGLPEVTLGLMPGFGGTVRLQRRVGAQAAAELIFTGEAIDASKALAIGLVRQVFPLAELRPAVQKIAEKIAARGPLGVRAAKQAWRLAHDASLDDACAFEAKAFALLFTSHDQKEGCKAFIEKRPAAFEGR